jgi:glycosyltransferase involved in cell wall biosynthesis
MKAKEVFMKTQLLAEKQNLYNDLFTEASKKQQEKIIHQLEQLVDENKLKTQTEEKERLRQLLNIKQNAFVILYAPDKLEQKDQLWLIEALNSLLKENNNVHVLLSKENQELVSNIEFRQQLHFLDSENDLVNYLSITDVVVSTVPIIIMGAMYLNLPVITINNHELVVDDVTGYIVKTEKHFIEHIRFLSKHKKFRKNLGSNGYKKIENYLTK